jgi:NADH-quinone oxidoreductase subunit N
MHPEPNSALTFIVTSPLLILAVGGMLTMLLEALGYLQKELSRTTLTALVLFSAACFLQPLLVINDIFLYRHFVADSLSAFFSLLILISSLAVVVMNHGSFEAQGIERGKDLNPLILFSTAGAVGLVSSNNLISLFLCIELLSIPVYVMAASAFREKSSAEGSLKYFTLGAVSSAFLLYGIALIYACTGTLDIELINNVILDSQVGVSPLLLVAAALLVFGLAFKLSLSPFHFWTPDAYQGAPLGINAYMSVIVKAAAFGAVLRIFGQALQQLAVDFQGFFILLGVISMLVGNLSAIRQKSIKRLFAYSSIAHAGYAIVCLPLLPSIGAPALMNYILFYSLSSLGVFAVLIGHLGGTRNQYEDDNLSALKGMSQRDPVAAILFAMFVLSLAGIPPLAGFFGKYYVLSALVRSHYLGLATIVVLNSAISLFYYLKIAALAFEAGDDVNRVEFPQFSSRIVSVVSGLVVLSSVFIVDLVAPNAAGDLNNHQTTSIVGK